MKPIAETAAAIERDLHRIFDRPRPTGDSTTCRLARSGQTLCLTDREWQGWSSTLGFPLCRDEYGEYVYAGIPEPDEPFEAVLRRHEENKQRMRQRCKKPNGGGYGGRRIGGFDE